MTGKESFLDAIVANPDDDQMRLVFADWLEENGESVHADFIRLQCELEPMRDRFELSRAYELQSQEEKLLYFDSKQGKQLSKALGQAKLDKLLDREEKEAVRCWYRRGFLHTLGINAELYIKHAEALHEIFPTLRKLKIYWLNGFAEPLAKCKYLRNVPELELACWYEPNQAQALAASSHLQQLEKLTIWLGGDGSAIPETELISLMASSQAWPNLKEITLWSLEEHSNAKEFVALANKSAGRSVAKHFRALDDRIPIAGDFDYFCAGRLEDGRMAVARLIENEIYVIAYKENGKVAETYTVPAPAEKLITDPSHYAYPGLLKEDICEIVDLTPAFIRVLKAPWPDDWFHMGNTSAYFEVCDIRCIGYVEGPDGPCESTQTHFTCGFGGETDRIVEDGTYYCDDAWCNKWGRVTST